MSTFLSERGLGGFPMNISRDETVTSSFAGESSLGKRLEVRIRIRLNWSSQSRV
jgi:hypothetical protein